MAALIYLHNFFTGIIGIAGTALSAVHDTNANALLHPIALNLTSAANIARRVVTCAILLQTIIQKVMAMVIGVDTAARLMAYTCLIFFGVHYYISQRFLGFSIWCFRLIYKYEV